MSVRIAGLRVLSRAVGGATGSRAAAYVTEGGGCMSPGGSFSLAPSKDVATVILVFPGIGLIRKEFCVNLVLFSKSE